MGWNRRLKAIAVGLGIALSVLTARHWYETYTLGHPNCDNCRADFPALYAGAKLMWENPSALYNLDQQLAIQRTIDPRIGDSILGFAYPPFTAFLMMPLGSTSFPNAFLVMSVVNGVILFIALKLLIGHLALNREQSTWLLATTFCNFGVHSTILQGQTSLAALLLVILYLRSVRQENEVQAGLWSSALSFKPQLLAVPLFVLAIRRKWRAFMVCVAVIGGLAIFSGIVIGPKAIADYIEISRRVSGLESDLGTHPREMQNLRALAVNLGSGLVALYVWAVLGGLTVAGVVILNRTLRDGDKSTVVQWIGNLAAILLLSPHVHVHDLALLVVPSALALSLFRDSVPVGLSIGLILIGILPLLSFVLAHPPPLVPFVLLSVFAFCLWFVRRSTAAA
jgi:hypothetical protein